MSEHFRSRVSPHSRLADLANPDARLLADVAACPQHLLPGLLVAIAARMAEPEPPAPERDAEEPPARNGDRWLDVAAVAARLGKDRRWVYRRCSGWDFVVREGRSLMFSERGLSRWMERHLDGASDRA